MKTYCILIPHQDYTEADAIIETGFKITRASLFEQAINEIMESHHGIFALEIYNTRQVTALCFTASGSTIDILCGELYSIFPGVDIVEIPDFTQDFSEHDTIVTADVRLGKEDIVPLQNYKTLQVDSMTPILSTLSRFPPEGRFIVQIVLQPIRDTASLHLSLKGSLASYYFKRMLSVKYKLKRGALAMMDEKIHEKTHVNLCRANMRIAVILPGKGEEDSHRFDSSSPHAELRSPEEYIESILGGFSEVNHPDLNHLRITRIARGVRAMRRFQDRDLSSPFRISGRELSTLWHPPAVGPGKNLAQLTCRKGSPPRNLPSNPKDSDICFFGHTTYREKYIPFGIKRADRRRHMYVVGKSGAGKSKLLQLLARSDIESGHGLAILDPHGDLVDEMLRLIPEHRVKDVVLFDPGDSAFPPSFNPFMAVPDSLKMRVTIGFLEIFKKIFITNWSDRMEHLLRYTVLALLGTPGATLLSVKRMIQDEEYRGVILRNVSDRSVKNFWINEFPQWLTAHDADVIAPLLNKVGQFVASNLIRNVVGQPINRFDFRQIMDERKILLMKVSKGILGDDNASLIGSMVVAKIYQAAMSRADIAPEERDDFYFYVDEFHNFATESFSEILSESRKYGLNLTMANQFLGQLPDSIRKTVFGNVGSLLSFKVGGDDANYLASEFKPRFSATDLMNLDLREFYLKMSVDGETQEAFSGRTLEVEYPPEDLSRACIDFSRANYSLPLEEVNDILSIWEEAA